MSKKPLDLSIEPAFVLIIRAIRMRGPDQDAALAEMDRRRLWLSPEQRDQAGLRPT